MTRPVEIQKFKAPGPTYDVNALYYPSDHGGDWVYEPHEPFTKKDVVTPGHFDAYRDELRVGSRITCRLGKIEDGITEVELQIIECPRWERLGHVMVSYKNQQGKFVCVRHDGLDETEKPEGKEKAA